MAALLTLVGAMVASCSGEADDATTSTDGAPRCTPDLASVHRSVIAPSCLGGGCHTATAAAGDLDLSTPDALAATVGRTAAGCDRPLVVAGDPDGSFLYEKLLGAPPGCGGAMPPGNPLDAASVACIAGWIADAEATCETCGGTGCVDLQTAPTHCGECEVVCPAGSACEGGECTCPPNQSFCAGVCVDTSSDPENCGGCDMLCGDLFCSLGSCKDTCDAGLLECGAACVDATTSEEHCGGCDQPCGPEEVCEGGTCGCPGGADTQTDPENCGTCGNVCGPGLDCVGGECTCGATSVSFAADVQPIFDARCLGNACHGGVMPSGSLDLRPGASYEALVGVASSQCASRLLVDPGDPQGSYLIDKVRGVNLCFGSKMPKMGALSGTEEQTLTSWICAGALDD